MRHVVLQLDCHSDSKLSGVLFRVDWPEGEEGLGDVFCAREWNAERKLLKKERGPRLQLPWEPKRSFRVLSIQIADEGRRVQIRAVSRSIELDLSIDALPADERTWMRIVLAEIADDSRCELVDEDGTPEPPGGEIEDEEMTPGQRELAAITKEVFDDADESPPDLDAILPKLEDLVARYPTMLDARIALGGVLVELGDYDKAIPQFEEALRVATAQHPMDELFGMLVEALGRAGRDEEAIAWHHRRLELTGHGRQAIGDYFRTLMDLERYEEILAECERLEGRAPSWFFFLARGEALMRLKRLDEAMGWFRKYEKEHPREPVVQLRMADVHLLRGDIAKARKACERAEKFASSFAGSKNEASLLLTLAVLWRRTGDQAGMRRVMKKIRRLDPGLGEGVDPDE